MAKNSQKAMFHSWVEMMNAVKRGPKYGPVEVNVLSYAGV
jgi:hypothetical protein